MRATLLTLLLLSSNAYSQRAPLWVGSWAASQQIPEPNNALSADDLRNATLRQIVHLSIGGSAIRVHLSNAFGIAPLHLLSVQVAMANTDRALTFSGRPDVIIPAGTEYISDPLDGPIPAGADLTISIHYSDPPEQQTSHPGSRASSYIVHGDLVKKIDHWYQLSAVDVATTGGFSIVTLGDSITDGRGSTTNGNDRWPDILARRLQSAGMNVGVLNQGIGGNHLLTDGLGPNALARFDRDVLAQTGVRYVLVLEGINDLGGLARTTDTSRVEHADLVQRIIAAYEQMVARAHAHNLFVIGCTILPDTGSAYYHPNTIDEADRQAVNTWIKTPGHFDDVIDFDQIARDPAQPNRLRPEFDSGDHLHPNPAGYAAMANSIPLSLFKK
jgi:lysophospholipase L1-like esterase